MYRILLKVSPKFHNPLFQAFIIIFTIYCILKSCKKSIAVDISTGKAQNRVLEYDPVRILCYILLDGKRFHVAQIIHETWGSHCDKLIFFTSSSFVKVENGNFTVIQLSNSEDSYDLLWGKTKGALLHLNENFVEEFEWFFKADLDTFLIVDNLRRFIKDRKLQSEESLWFGFKMKHKKMQHGYMSGGAGYALNSRAIRNFAALMKLNQEKDFIEYDSEHKVLKGCKTATNHGIEDLELGRCFHALSVKDVNTVDRIGRHKFLPLNLFKILQNDIQWTHWIWHQSWHKFTAGKLCCSSELISMHEVPPFQQRILYYLLYELKSEIKYN